MAPNRSSSQVRSQLRSHMPVANEYAYFDHAAVSPLPDCAVEAFRAYAHSSSHSGDAQWLGWAAELNRLRTSAAQLLSAAESEIALVPNTTHGIGLIAEGIPWTIGDSVVVPTNEFPSNLMPWRNLQRYGVEVREIAAANPSTGELDLELLLNAVDSSTRVLALSWVGYATGYRIDVAEVVERAHAKGCWVFLDAIQGLGAFSLNVCETGVDFVAADGHKWLLGPEGAGLLYIAERHLDRLVPLGIGWNSLASGAFDDAPKILKQSAARYEGGTVNMPGMHALGASLNLLLSQDCHLAASPVAQAILENNAQLSELLQRAGFDVPLPRNPQVRSGIVPVRWPGADSEVYAQARKFLLDQKIVTSVRGGSLRVAAHAYNSDDDAERLVNALRDFRKQTG